MHHVILLWPLPHMIVGICVGYLLRTYIRSRVTVVLAIMFVAGSNLLVINQHLAHTILYGPTSVWTDAITPLYEHLKSLNARQVFLLDWGMFDALRLLGRGTLPLSFPPDASMTPRELLLRDVLLPAGNVFVRHTSGNERRPQEFRKFAEALSANGYRRRIVGTILDRHGRPIFEVFRLTPAAPLLASH